LICRLNKAIFLQIRDLVPGLYCLILDMDSGRYCCCLCVKRSGMLSGYQGSFHYRASLWGWSSGISIHNNCM